MLMMTTLSQHWGNKMSKMKSVYEVLMEWYPDGKYTEEQLWEAIAEADGYTQDYYEDGDLTEWL